MKIIGEFERFEDQLEYLDEYKEMVTTRFYEKIEKIVNMIDKDILGAAIVLK